MTTLFYQIRQKTKQSRIIRYRKCFVECFTYRIIFWILIVYFRNTLYICLDFLFLCPLKLSTVWINLVKNSTRIKFNLYHVVGNMLIRALAHVYADSDVNKSVERGVLTLALPVRENNHVESIGWMRNKVNNAKLFSQSLSSLRKEKYFPLRCVCFGAPSSKLK